MSYPETPPPHPSSPLPPVWIFSGIADFSTVQKSCYFCNDSKDELKEHPNKKDWILQSKDSYSYRIEQPKGDSGTASACQHIDKKDFMS